MHGPCYRSRPVALAARQRHSFLEYLAIEEMNPVRHEFCDGEAWAMAGGSPDHAAIAINVASVLREQLRGRPCRVFGSDLRIRVRASGLATYPDASVVCSHLEVDPDDPSGHTVVNPTLLVEVLSPSTEAYDRGEKLAHYKRIPSLREVVLVAQDERRLELWRRDGERWTVELARGDEVAHLSSIDCALPLAEIYLDPLA
jgi:Uma2 family endonuclease